MSPLNSPAKGRRHRGQTGSAAVELTLLTPLLVVLLLFAVAAGRLVEARLHVDGAARHAARAASLARDPATATAAAHDAAHAAVADRGPACRTLRVAVDVAAFRPGGHVGVRVSCIVALADLTLLRLPGTRVLDGAFTAPVDQFRGATS